MALGEVIAEPTPEETAQGDPKGAAFLGDLGTLAFGTPPGQGEPSPGVLGAMALSPASVRALAGLPRELQRMGKMISGMAHRYAGRGQSVDDYVQAGITGALESMKGYDPSKGAAATSWAFNFARKAMQDLANRQGPVTLNWRVTGPANKVSQAEGEFFQRYGREPGNLTRAAIARRLGMSADEYEQARTGVSRAPHIERGLGKTPVDPIDTMGQAPAQGQHMDMARARQILATLPPAQQEALKQAFSTGNITPAARRGLIEMRRRLGVPGFRQLGE